MKNKKKFRADLYKSYIACGVHDHARIQESIKVAETFVFGKKEITVTGFQPKNENDCCTGSYALSRK